MPRLQFDRRVASLDELDSTEVVDSAGLRAIYFAPDFRGANEDERLRVAPNSVAFRYGNNFFVFAMLFTNPKITGVPRKLLTPKDKLHKLARRAGL